MTVGGWRTVKIGKSRVPIDFVEWEETTAPDAFHRCFKNGKFCVLRYNRAGHEENTAFGLRDKNMRCPLCGSKLPSGKVVTNAWKRLNERLPK